MVVDVGEHDEDELMPSDRWSGHALTVHIRDVQSSNRNRRLRFGPRFESPEGAGARAARARVRDNDDVYVDLRIAFTLLAPRYIQAGMDALSIRNTTITSFASTHMQLSENDERVVVCGGRRAV